MLRRRIPRHRRRLHASPNPILLLRIRNSMINRRHRTPILLLPLLLRAVGQSETNLPNHLIKRLALPLRQLQLLLRRHPTPITTRERARPPRTPASHLRQISQQWICPGVAEWAVDHTLMHPR